MSFNQAIPKWYLNFNREPTNTLERGIIYIVTPFPFPQWKENKKNLLKYEA